MDLLTGLFLGSQLFQFGTTLGAKNAVSSGYSDASTAVSNAGKYGIDLQMDLFNQAMQSYTPYQEAGVNALQQYQDVTLPSATIDFKFDPTDETYKIRQEETEKAINRFTASRGLYNSSAALNTLEEATRKLTAEETQNQYQRSVDQYNREMTQATNLQNQYANLINAGMSSTNALANLASSTGRNVADIYQTIGQTQAQAAIGQGQAQSGLLQDIGTIPSNALAQYYLLNKLAGGTGLGSGTTGSNNLIPATGTNALTLGAGEMLAPTAGSVALGPSAAGIGTTAGYSAVPGGTAPVWTGTGTNALATGTGSTGTTAGITGNAALGTIGAGILAAPVLGPSITNAVHNAFSKQTAAGGADVIRNYLAGTAAGTDIGYGTIMPDQSWFSNPSNVAAMLTNWPGNYGTTIEANNPLVQQVLNKQVSYNDIDRLVRQYGTYNDPTAH